MLIASTAFLVNMLLLLSYAIGHSFNSMLASADANMGVTLIVSLLSYLVIAVTTVILVGMHTQVRACNDDRCGSQHRSSFFNGIGEE
jgi:hypothetical protein